ncbi:MAG: ATP phosphoribosyltransferase regulatory subunit [Alphaproteobacteria bacterium]|nr:ATP phosphoribosyltransferase regulatory subunit [Alphaproteobacteria bacterium]
MSSDIENRALLPSGLNDLLPPRAAQEAGTVSALTDAFAAFGYEQVKPPLVEFETTLIGAAENGGGSLAGQMFRLMDPASQRMMAVRADITLQVARIAETRLRDTARPLRLSYAGEVLRVRGSQLRPERLFAQAGVELIGAADVSADIEVVVLAAEALAAAGIAAPTIDLNSPALVAHLLADVGVEDAVVAQLRVALDPKDAASGRDITRTHGVAFGAAARVLDELVSASGTAEDVLPKLHALELPDSASAELARLEAVVTGVRAARAELSLTLDPVEYRGFEYHTGVSFTVFAAGVRGELGRGGRYITTAGEAATGFSLYLDSIMRALPEPSVAQKMYVPFGAPAAIAGQLRADDWITVAGLAPEEDARAEALRLSCSHCWHNGEILSLSDRGGNAPAEK